jgi:EmrB/QacA subfamily drug resistance transporter
MAADCRSARLAGMSRKQGALVAAILGSTVVTVDATVVNVALPKIADDLGGGLAGQQWVANAYLLTLASLILVAGSLADIFGERRIFVAGVALFGVFSLACALAPTVGVLIVARGLQGVAGALLTPAALAIIVSVFPQDERGAAIGSWTAWSGVGILIGPLLGGQIVDHISWRWVFGLNVPLVLATLAIASRYVPEGMRAADRPRPRVDVRGAMLCAVGLGLISFALIERRWWVLAPGLALFAAFVVLEARTPDPMLPLGLFRRRAFTVANLETLSMYGGIAIFGFFLTIFLQQVAGWSATEAGAVSLIPTGVMFALSRRAGALADRYGPRWFMAGGPFLVAGGFLLMLRFDQSTSFLTDVLPAMLLFSLGLAATVSPLTATVLADADESDAGIASAVNNAVARTAGLLATAAVGAVIASAWTAKIDDIAVRTRPSGAAAQVLDGARDQALRTVDRARAGDTIADEVAQAGVESFHIAVVIGAVMLAAAGTLGAVFLRNPRRRTAAECCPGGAVVGASEEVGAPPAPAQPAGARA